MSGQQQQLPTVIDFSEGHYRLGKTGKELRVAVHDKAKKLEDVSKLLMTQLTNEIGTSAGDTAGLIVAIVSGDRSTKASWVYTIAESIANMQKERQYLLAIYRGTNDHMNYVLSPVEMERFGLV